MLKCHHSNEVLTEPHFGDTKSIPHFGDLFVYTPGTWACGGKGNLIRVVTESCRFESGQVHHGEKPKPGTKKTLPRGGVF